MNSLILGRSFAVAEVSAETPQTAETRKLQLQKEQLQQFNSWQENFRNLTPLGFIDAIESNVRNGLMIEGTRLTTEFQLPIPKSDQFDTVTDSRLIMLAHSKLNILMMDPNDPKNAETGSFNINPELIEAEEAFTQVFIALNKDEQRIVDRIVSKVMDEQYFQKLQEGINEEAVDDVDRQLGETLSYYSEAPSGEKKLRKEGLVIFNGPAGSGKGTAAGNADLETLETGTNGILGREGEDGERYRHWDYICRRFDACRKNGVMFPDKLMRLFLADEAIRVRGAMDAKGIFDIGIALSGYPRTAGQADALFKYMEASTVKAVEFTMTEVTAGNRIAQRIALDQLSGSAGRDDDLVQLLPESITKLRKFLGKASNKLPFSMLKQRIGLEVARDLAVSDEAYEPLPALPQPGESELAENFQQEVFRTLGERAAARQRDLSRINRITSIMFGAALVQEFRQQQNLAADFSFLAPGARYLDDVRRASGVTAAIGKLNEQRRPAKQKEIPLPIQIAVDLLTPGEQAAQLVQALGREPLQAAETN